jgi:microcystin-dependent protein
MASTYSTSLKIQEIGNGEQAGVWGNTTNTNWQLIEQAVAGVQTITMINANYTLTNLNGVLDEARNMVLVVQGTNSAIYQVIAPLNQPKMYVISNQTTGGYAITIGASSGAVISIPNGTTAQVYTDGTNFYSAQTGSAGDFKVNGNFTVTGNQTDTGNLTVGGTFTASNSATFSVGPTAPTATTGTNTTQLATTAFVNASIAASPSTVSGAILMWPTASAPSGYLLCDGTAVSRTTYATLFALFGTTFGSGDGSTTFNLPNYTGRMPYGTTIGATGGSADAVVVSHTHTATVTDPGHTHTAQGHSGAQISTGGPYTYASSLNNATFSGVNSATTGISVANSTAGVSGTNANLPPYLGINFIIKT